MSMSFKCTSMESSGDAVARPSMVMFWALCDTLKLSMRMSFLEQSIVDGSTFHAVSPIQIVEGRTSIWAASCPLASLAKVVSALMLPLIGCSSSSLSLNVVESMLSDAEALSLYEHCLPLSISFFRRKSACNDCSDVLVWIDAFLYAASLYINDGADTVRSMQSAASFTVPFIVIGLSMTRLTPVNFFIRRASEMHAFMLKLLLFCFLYFSVVLGRE